MGGTLKVINLFAGPGVGKSTLAADLFARFKRDGFKVELSREQAKEMLYWGRKLSDVQIMIAALQYQHLKDIEKADTQVAICDGPLMLGTFYCAGKPYALELAKLLGALTAEFDNVNVLLHRTTGHKYLAHGREHTEDEAKWLDVVMRTFGSYHYQVSDPHAAACVDTLYAQLKARCI